MSRSFPQPNNYRTCPLPAPDRGFPLAAEETPFRVAQGSAKAVQLGQLVCPFRELHVSKDSTITQIRYKQDAGEWIIVDQGDYPTLLRAVQAVQFTPQEFGSYEFSQEITAAAFIPVRRVDISAAVSAGADKVTEKNAAIKPFFDASFAIDSSLLSTVEYAVDDGDPAAIPATFGADLIDRVKNFSIYFATAGEKKIALIITDTNSNESSDHLLARVGS